MPTRKFGICIAIATKTLMSVLGPVTAILFFACQKKSIQKKRHPDAAYLLRCYENHPWFSPFGPSVGCSNLLQANLSLSPGVARRGFLPLRQRYASLHRSFGLFPAKAPVIGAAYGSKPAASLKFWSVDDEFSIWGVLMDPEKYISERLEHYQS
ncbi:hypothetical protein A1353_09025 [Methylomonas methanica]|uniref:Uncharacterized protein n=1 Tax=Methylomonas methanica TaxID=421 RepID=A0A177MKN8_METMH|nr:hypothetical protein [Methylomonas methanica]OAI06358.1 hypothetical protein A1353_09025 [Methylomonas methanica]